jgi:hypothetical protein
LRMRSGLPGMDSETVTRADDFSCTHGSCEHTPSHRRADSTYPDLIDVGAASTNDDTSVLGDNETPHGDLLDWGLSRLDGRRGD